MRKTATIRDRILWALKRHGGTANNRELGVMLEIAPHRISGHLTGMAKRGLVNKLECGSQGKPSLWRVV